ncbi:MAG TPA: beta-propeller domain-containing protein [Capillimicrobium sp.]
MTGRGLGIGALSALAAGALALPADAARLRSFDSCPQLVSYAQANLDRSFGPTAGEPMVTPRPEAVTAAPGADAGKAAEPTAPEADSSATNVQEAGIDEPDTVKVSGRHLLAVAGTTLYAVDARAERPAIVGSVELPDGGSHELLVRGGRALVIASGPWRSLPEPLPRPVGPTDGVTSSKILPAGEPTTVLAELDISDPAAMRVLRTLTFDGSPVSARLTGETARVVTSSSPHWYVEPAVRERADGWLPTATLRGRRGKTRSVQRLVDCDDVRRPATFAGAGMLSVLTVDLDAGLTQVDTDAVMTDAQTVYASAESLYVATQRWDASPVSNTEIHRFDAAKRGETTYRATGSVPGHLLNQFSLSEHDGVLRAATTQDGPEGSESLVTTLRARDGGLERVGQVGGLGKTERIYAVRFIDDVGYVVTFRQTDPLYTIDLSDPAQPRVAGELKIPGYSAYLHPVGDGLLLGVGQDATDEGRVRGTQLSLFDVSDPAAPKRLHQRTLGQGSSSDVEWDHHAFLWWPATKLAVLPVYQPDFQGTIGFRVDRAAGIDEAGRASHETYASPRRTVVIGGRLLTISDAGVEFGSLDTLAEQAWVPFPQPAPHPEPGSVEPGGPVAQPGLGAEPRR